MLGGTDTSLAKRSKGQRGRLRGRLGSENAVQILRGGGLVLVEAVLVSELDSGGILGPAAPVVVEGVVKAGALLPAAPTTAPATIPVPSTASGLDSRDILGPVGMVRLLLAAVTDHEFKSTAPFPPAATYPTASSASLTTAVAGMVRDGDSFPAVSTRSSPMVSEILEDGSSPGEGTMFGTMATTEPSSADGATVSPAVRLTVFLGLIAEKDTFPRRVVELGPVVAMTSSAVGMTASSFVVRVFNLELERVRADDALVADKRELGAWREGRVGMVKQGFWKGNELK